MDLNYKEILPADFASDSRVWIYQSDRLFTMNEALQIKERLMAFAESWKSHGTPVKAYGNLIFGQFIVLMADESATGVSGCSTDGSVRLIKQIEEQYSVTLFDRQLLAFLIKDKIQLLQLNQLNSAAENNLVNADTLYFNNTVQTKQALQTSWIIPVKDSWLSKKIFANTIGK